jgi:hypothetical protein
MNFPMTNVFTDAKRGDESADTPWYRDSAAAVAEGLAKRGDESADTPWYRDSAAAVAEGLSKRGDESTDTPWYRDSAAAVAEGLNEKRGDESTDTPWYRDSAAAVAEGLTKRDTYNDKSEEKEAANRDEAYGNMRSESLRRSSEKGKAFFIFTPHPRNDTVDRWNVPVALKYRYETAETDADRVSILNNYLYATARTPKPAEELGFVPTMMMPGIPDNGNEVGYGYALEGQHQHHCANVVADAIDIGKDNMNDFFLKHVIHCLSLIKTFATKLKDPQPVTILTPEAEALIKANFRKTID